MVVWKFEMKKEVLVPKGSRILSVQYQGLHLYVWFLVPDPSVKEMVTKRFLILATGEENPVSSNVLEYICTVQQGYVWHIFEVQHVVGD